MIDRKKHCGEHLSFPVICKECGICLNPRYDNHILHKNGCPGCYGNFPWTFSRFLSEAVAIHGEKYDYSAITEEMVVNISSKVPIKCNKCTQIFHMSINSHIHQRSGCVKCAGRGLSLNEFIKRSRELYGWKYGYFEVSSDDCRNKRNMVMISCNKCSNEWSVRIRNHINGETRCPICMDE